MDFALGRVKALEFVKATGPSVPLDEVSVLSISRLLEATDGVLDPVPAGDWTSLSFTGEGLDVGVTKVFSLPVTASEIARKPMTLRALAEMPCGGSGERLPRLPCVENGEAINTDGVLSSSRLVTVGETPGPLDDRAIGARALEDRSRPLNVLLWYALEADEVTSGMRSRTESALLILECLLAAEALGLWPSVMLEP